jgi:hypothetical protein
MECRFGKKRENKKKVLGASPCANPQCLLDTRGLYTRASLSPTPTLSRKLLLSIMAASLMKASMEASSHPLAGSRRSERRDVSSFDRRVSACDPCAT